MPAYYYWYFDYTPELTLQSEIAWEVCWCLAKVTIYSLYAYRYYILQQASIHNRATKNARNIRFGLIGVCICVQIGLEIAMSINYYNWSDLGWDDPEYLARQRRYLNFAWCVVSMDFVLVIVLGYLILRTILQLVIAINDPAHKSMSTKQETTRSGHSEVSAPAQSTAGSVSTPPAQRQDGLTHMYEEQEVYMI
eukprot:155899_1